MRSIRSQNTYQKRKKSGVRSIANGQRTSRHSSGGGWQVERSSIDDGQDFFTYQPEDFDVIVSNPPYTQKDRVIERLYELEKPFAVLLPLNSLQGVGRYRYFKNGIQILTFDKRIGFHNAESMEEYKKGSSFATAYFCRDILPRDLILEELREYRKPLKEA